MNNICLRNSFLRAAALAVFSAIWVATIDAQRGASEEGWQQSTTLSVRLGVKGQEGQAEVYDALFTVSTLDYPNGRLTHEIKKKIFPGEFTHLYFPEDLHVRARAGRYEWTCTVGDEVVARGQFEYTGEGGQTNQAKVLQ